MINNFKIIFLLCILPSVMYSQPIQQWATLLRSGLGNEDKIVNIYINDNFDIVFCGMSSSPEAAHGWVGKVDSEGGLIWSNNFRPENSPVTSLYSIIEVSNGGYLSVGFSTRMVGPRAVTALRIDDDGEIMWINCFGGERYDEARATIELKSGNYLVAGMSNSFNNYNDGYVLLLSDEGDLIWERNYGQEDRYDGFSAIRESDGGILLLGRSVRGHGKANYWLVKINEEDGEVIWEQYYGNDEFDDFHGAAICTITDGSGYVISGTSRIEDHWAADSYFTAIRINRQGEQQWLRRYIPVRQPPIFLSNGVAVEAGGFVLVGAGAGALALGINGAGDSLWFHNRLIPEDALSSGYLAVRPMNDGGVIVGGATTIEELEGRITYGLLSRFLPSESPPNIIYYEPDSLNLVALVNDSIIFKVRAIDYQNDSISYQWYLGEDTLGTDTTEVIPFTEMGQFEVKCVVSDHTGADSVAWTVNIEDLFINAHSPEALSMTIRRGTNIDFAIETRSIGDEPVSYEWTLKELPLGQEETVSEEMQYSHQFNLTREYIVTAYAWRDEAIDSRAWNVSVKSVIYDYWPESSEVSIDTGRIVRFGVEPFDPEAEGLETTWYLEDELLSHELEVDLGFPAEGLYDVMVIARDGEDADTVSWEVRVNIPVSVSDEYTTVKQFTLHPAHPNPFNRMTTLRFDLPSQDMVKLAIYDTQGRLVKTLLNDYRSAGNYVVEWDASGYSAGVYLIKLETGSGYRSVGKVVLVP